MSYFWLSWNRFVMISMRFSCCFLTQLVTCMSMKFFWFHTNFTIFRIIAPLNVSCLLARMLSSFSWFFCGFFSFSRLKIDLIFFWQFLEFLVQRNFRFDIFQYESYSDTVSSSSLDKVSCPQKMYRRTNL